MANKPVQPYAGPTAVDVTPMGSILVDVPQGVMPRLRRQQAGIDEVITEVDESVPAFATQVGLSQDIHVRFQACNNNLQQIRAARAVVDRLAEALEDSEAKYEDDRETIIGQIVDSVKSAARRIDISLLGPFEKTIAYNSQIAVRAAKTRRKNAAAAEAEAETEPQPATARQ
jgi:hypothetical protein